MTKVQNHGLKTKIKGEIYIYFIYINISSSENRVYLHIVYQYVN